MRRRLLGLAIGGVLVAMPGVCSASTNFPDFINQHLGAACPLPPKCTICHRTLSGGIGSVSTVFGKKMMELGLSAFSTATLQRALDLSKAQHIDSDGDGDTDIDALLACKDPNVANASNVSNAEDGGGDGAPAPPIATPTAFTDPTPEYGCASGRALPGDGVWAAIAAAGIFALRRRQSRARAD